MKFWTVLRWSASTVFVVLLLAVWLGADTGGVPAPRPAPTITR
jgi:hypothetical protein